MDLKSGKLILSEITDEYTHDTKYLAKTLSRANRRNGKVLFDGVSNAMKLLEGIVNEEREWI